RRDLNSTLGWAIRGLIERRAFDEALQAADQFLAPLDLRHPGKPAEEFEAVLRGKTSAMKLRVLDAEASGQREDFSEEAGAWADQVLSALPDHPEMLWWPILSELGRLRLECQLCQVLRMLYGTNPDPEQARYQLEN